MRKYDFKIQIFAALTGLLIILQCEYIKAQVNKPDQIEKRIDKVFASYDNSETPGVAVVVVKNNNVVFEKGYGVANLDSKSMVSPETVFNIGSVSKQFTVFTILLLEQDGKLSIEDDIRKYLPEMHQFGKTITLRHLINHTSGLRDAYLLSTMAGWRQGDIATHEQRLRLVFRQRELEFNPGEQFSYTNTGTLLLSEIVARVSGMSFARFAKERVFEPVGMKSTFVMNDFERVVENFSYSYYKPGDEYKIAINPSAVQGYSNVYSTARDMSLWAMNFSSPKVGGAEIIKKMRTKTRLNNGAVVRFAMGQNFTPYKGLVHIEHTGSHRAYLAYLGRFPEQNISIIVLSNNEQLKSDLFSKSYGVADVFLSKYYSSKNVVKPAPSGSPTLNSVKLTNDKLEKFSGLYWNEKDKYSRKIYVKDSTLMYFRGENNETRLVPISQNEFKMLGTDLIVKFGRNSKNERTMSVTEGTDTAEFIEYKPANYSSNDLATFTGRYYSEELDASYTFRIEKGKLIARHLRLDDVELAVIKADLFRTNRWFFNRVEFIRKNGKLIGLRASNVRVNNVWFKKVE